MTDMLYRWAESSGRVAIAWIYRYEGMRIQNGGQPIKIASILEYAEDYAKQAAHYAFARRPDLRTM